MRNVFVISIFFIVFSNAKVTTESLISFTYFMEIEILTVSKSICSLKPQEWVGAGYNMEVLAVWLPFHLKHFNSFILHDCLMSASHTTPFFPMNTFNTGKVLFYFVGETRRFRWVSGQKWFHFVAREGGAKNTGANQARASTLNPATCVQSSKTQCCVTVRRC